MVYHSLPWYTMIYHALSWHIFMRVHMHIPLVLHNKIININMCNICNCYKINRSSILKITAIGFSNARTHARTHTVTEARPCVSGQPAMCHWTSTHFSYWSMAQYPVMRDRVQVEGPILTCIGAVLFLLAICLWHNYQWERLAVFVNLQWVNALRVSQDTSAEVCII